VSVLRQESGSRIFFTDFDCPINGEKFRDETIEIQRYFSVPIGDKSTELEMQNLGKPVIQKMRTQVAKI
jgi:hypothetical protein